MKALLDLKEPTYSIEQIAAKKGKSPIFMPLLFPADRFPIRELPRIIPPTLRPFQYVQMQNWASNNFVNNWHPVLPRT